MVAYPDHGEGNDPEPFFLGGRGGGGWGGWSFTTKAQHFYSGQYMGVMICLSQGGLLSLSASSFFFQK